MPTCLQKHMKTSSHREVAEKEIMQFLRHLYKVKTEPLPLTSVEVDNTHDPK